MLMFQKETKYSKIQKVFEITLSHIKMFIDSEGNSKLYSINSDNTIKLENKETILRQVIPELIPLQVGYKTILDHYKLWSLGIPESNIPLAFEVNRNLLLGKKFWSL